MKKLFYLLSLLMFSSFAVATVVRFETTVGNIDIELYDAQTPITVQNFLNYVNDGDYDDSVIHRTDPGFIVQGGGWSYLGNDQFDMLDTDPAIVSEAGLPNVRGTIAMALFANGSNVNVNSATNQWFFNLTDNAFLDDFGFTPFGEVIRGMETLDLIESMLRTNYFEARPAGAFGEFPLYRYDVGPGPSPEPIREENMLKINRAYVLSENFFINEGISGGWINPNTTGGLYIEVLPSVNVMILAWFTFDDTLPDSSVPSNIGDASNRWLTSSGNFAGNQYVGSLFATSGGLFDDPAVATTTEVGSINIEFNDCSTAEMTYVLDGVELSNTIPLQRVSGVNVDFCEQLAVEQNPGAATQ